MAKSDLALINHINNKGQKYFKKSKNEDFDNLISKLLIADPKERISWEQYFKHPFLTQNQILMNLKTNQADINTMNFQQKLTNLSNIFNNLKNIIKIDLSLFNTYEVTNMHNMFENCFSLKEVNLSGIYINKVTDMSYLFNKCYELKKIIFDDSFHTINVENMSYMFNECKNLEELNLPKSFITKNVKNMEGMFKNCNKLEKLDFEKFEINKFINRDYMFDGCYKLKNIPNKFIIKVLIIDENLKEYNYNEKLKWEEQDYSNKFHLEFELKKGFGNVKEYNGEGKLLFEGEYLNGGSSENKIYNNDNIILNIQNGNNKILFIDGKFLFSGVYFYKDKLIRKGKIYDDNGGLIFEGEI